MTSPPPTELFDAYYFQHGCGTDYADRERWMAYFNRVADRIVSGIGPRTVLDAGCALGYLVAALRERGVEAEGLDISEYAIAHVPEPVKPYCRVGSVLDPLPRRYDLIVCIEVLEHLPPAGSVGALANLCQSTDDIVFSSSPIDFKEATHFNVQPPEYWAGLFAEQGFVRDVDFDASVILPWSLRLRRTGAPLARLAADYERKYWRLAHENHELRQWTVQTRAELAAYEQLQVAHRALLEQHARVGLELELAVKEVAAVRAGLGWQIGTALAPWRQRLLPDGSRRLRLAQQWMKRLARPPK